MLEVEFLFKPFHCEGQDGFLNIKEHKVNKAFSRNKTSEGPLGPNLVSPATVEHNIYQLSYDFHYFDYFLCLCVLFLCWKSKKYFARISKTSQLKSWSATDGQGFDFFQNTVQKTHTFQKNSDQNYNERIIDVDRNNSYKYSERIPMKINSANINYFLILAASATTKTSCRSSLRPQRGPLTITCHPWMTFVSRTNRRGWSPSLSMPKLWLLPNLSYEKLFKLIKTNYLKTVKGQIIDFITFFPIGPLIWLYG